MHVSNAARAASRRGANDRYSFRRDDDGDRQAGAHAFRQANCSRVDDDRQAREVRGVKGGGPHNGLLPPLPEKVAQQSCGLDFTHAANDLRTMVAGCGVEDAGAVIDPAALGIIGAEDQPTNSEQTDSLGAHRAGFQRDDKVAVGQARIGAQGGCGAQSQEFGVSGGIVVGLCPVAGAREDGPVRAR